MMAASIIAYLMCAVCLVFVGAAIMTAIEATRGENDADVTVCTALLFVFGIGAWGFAYLGGLS